MSCTWSCIAADSRSRGCNSCGKLSFGAVPKPSDLCEVIKSLDSTTLYWTWYFFLVADLAWVKLPRTSFLPDCAGDSPTLSEGSSVLSVTLSKDVPFQSTKTSSNPFPPVSFSFANSRKLPWILFAPIISTIFLYAAEFSSKSLPVCSR